MPKLLSIHVGLPVDGSAYRKHPVDGPVRVGHERIDGDDQGAKQFHGGPERAVMAYAAGHYPLWNAEYPEQGFGFGAFAENFTVEGLDERNVCVGDRHRFGDVVLEVTCPRNPCIKIDHNNALPGLLLRVRETARIGWLYRVIQQGEVKPGCEIEVLPGPCPGWSVARVFDVFNRARAARELDDEARELLACEPLISTWREVLRSKLPVSSP